MFLFCWSEGDPLPVAASVGILGDEGLKDAKKPPPWPGERTVVGGVLAVADGRPLLPLEAEPVDRGE